MGQLQTAVAELKMTSKLRQEWSLHHGKPDCIQQVDDLIDFVYCCKKILKATTHSKEQKITSSNKPIKPTIGRYPKGVVLKTREAEMKCPSCEEYHCLYQCSAFKGWDLEC